MPKKSRLRRLGIWFATLFRSVGAVIYPPNVKNAFTNVTANWKEYICFYLAALVMSAGFFTVALCTEANLCEARDRVEEAYDYHVEVALLDNEQYANLDQKLQYQMTLEENARENEYLEGYYWANGDKPYVDGTYAVRLKLSDLYSLETAYDTIYNDILRKVTKGNREIRFSPLYTFDEDFAVPYNVQFWTVSLAWLALSILMMVVLFLIRLDHFRFIYGIYMTCGADFVRLVGVAGGELILVTAMTWIPAALIGGGITTALYVPTGVGLHVTVRAVLVSLLGGLAASFVSVWFPMRRLASQPPVRHLIASDNAALVSSPRRSFFLFGQSFPGKYELYGFWRMRKYYIRLVLSAVLFAAFFVTGLFIAELEAYHNDLDPAEYIVAYRPAGYYEQHAPAEDEENEEPVVWTPDPEEAEMIWDDVDLFYEYMLEIDGVSYAEWDATKKGNRLMAHLLLKPGQVYHAASFTVASDERTSEGYNKATARFSYKAVDKLWIDNMVKNDLCTFEGDPYRVLTEERHIIISEDIYNDKAFDYKPGDTILVAVCTETVPLEIVTDERELLRMQIDQFRFRYEPFTIAAVMRGMDSEDTITLGVTYDTYTDLVGAPPVRGEMMVYMEKGTDLDTVRAAEGEIRHLLASFKDWLVLPTGNYFDTQVRSLKNDGAVILTLAACLLLVSPMVWYFSQLMFYRKRRGEFAILHAMGAPDSAFAKLHRLAGGVLAGAAFLITAVLSFLCNYAVYFVVGTLLPKMHLTESVHYRFSISPPALIACILISILCGYLSCQMPYWLYTKKDIGTRKPD